MKEEKTFTIGDQKIAYVIIYKKIKKVYLKIEEGQIHIHCPYETPLTLIEDFILENYPKIKGYLENYRPLACYQDEGYVNLLKKKYNIKVIDMNIKKVVLKGDTLVFYHHQVEKVLEPYLKAWLKDYLETKVAMYCKQEKRFGDPIIELKKTKRRYGACYYRQNRIVFNPILIHFSTDFIDYVVVHELCHFIEPNHSKAFYEEVEKWLPDYKIRQREGNRYENQFSE